MLEIWREKNVQSRWSQPSGWRIS